MRGNTYNSDLTMSLLHNDILLKRNNKDWGVLVNLSIKAKDFLPDKVNVQTFYPSTSSIENALTKYFD